MKKRIYSQFIPLLFCCLWHLSTSGQETEVFYNEKYQKIKKSIFENKLKSKLFFTASWKNDTAKFHKLRYAEFFGKMDSIKHKQLKSQLSSKYNLNPNKRWLIYYIDSLPDVKKMPPKSGFFYIDTIAKDSIFIPRNGRRSKKFDREKYNYRFHVRSLKSYQKGIKRASKKSNSSVECFYLYNFNNGFSIINSKKFRLYKDPNQIVKKVFSDGQISYKAIILDIYGNFYVTSADNGEHQKIMLTEKGYSTYKRKWLKRIEELEL
jgi:hypothetical protein